jgi:hypothetical protein
MGLVSRLHAVRSLRDRGQFAGTFKEFPPIQKPNSFTIDDALAMMSEAAGGAGH